MTKTFKAFLCSLAVIAIVLVPACKTTKKQTVTAQPATVTETGPPTIAQPPAPTTVEPPHDFVKTDTEPQVREEALPANLDDLNRVAQERGYIQDAFFGYDESALSNEGQAALTNSANWLKKNPQYNILIEGHCDERGTEQYNLSLGERRALSVREYLVTAGIQPDRIFTISYGESRPADPGHNEAAWAKNRRGVFVLLTPK